MISSKYINNLASIVDVYSQSLDIKSGFNLDINTDSRTIKKGQTFVALKGENFDAYNYLEQVLESGAKCVVVEANNKRLDEVSILSLLYPNVCFVLVTSTLDFIQELAREHIKQWKKNKKSRVVIGVTGSNGKTTHKEMISALMNVVFPKKVLATKGNLNNHIGVPLTIFNLTEKHEVAIIEMGMSGFGEIKELCDIALPTAGMITNIGPAHIEFLKTVENIFLEKAALYDSVVSNTKGKGVFVVNNDDPYLAKLKRTPGLTFFGENSADVLVELDGQEITIHIDREVLRFSNTNLLETHNLKNLAGTITLAIKLFPSHTKKLVKAASEYKQPSMNRSEWIENIFLDAYNANPSSMKTSINSFIKVMDNKGINLKDCFFVVGDMNELGEFAESMHKEIAEHMESSGINNVAFIGRYKDFYKKGYTKEAMAFGSKEEFIKDWKKIKKKYKFIFIKASRSLKLETLLNID